MRENGTRIRRSGRRRGRTVAETDSRDRAPRGSLPPLPLPPARSLIESMLSLSLLSRTLTAPGNANRCRSRCARRNFVARAYCNRRDLSGLIVRSTRDELSRFRDDIKELPIIREGSREREPVPISRFDSSRPRSSTSINSAHNLGRVTSDVTRGDPYSARVFKCRSERSFARTRRRHCTVARSGSSYPARAYLATDLATIETIESIKIPLDLAFSRTHSSFGPCLPAFPRASAILSFIRRVFKAPAVPGADFTNEASDLYDRSANRGVRGRRAPQVTEFIVKWHPAATHDPYRLH